MQRNSAGRFKLSQCLSAQNLSEKTDGRTLWASGHSPSTKEQSHMVLVGKDNFLQSKKEISRAIR
jgi:hypothetical protein